MKVSVYKNNEALCEGFTDFLQKELAKRSRLNLSLSGGSTPQSLFKYWAENNDGTINWQQIAFFWGDERCVPSGDPMSNYGVAKEQLFDKVPQIDKELIHYIHGENTPSEEAVRYGKVLDTYLPKENGIPCLDILMLGMGGDGHTASIFPNQIELWDSPQNCVPVKHPDTGMPRISFTGKIINNARNIAFLATGAGKAEKVKQVIEQRELAAATYPAARVHPEHGELYWFLDEEAAKLL
jgi:6-phosphogluconolactonase